MSSTDTGGDPPCDGTGPEDSSVVVNLPSKLVQEARRLAEDDAKRYGRRAGTYGLNETVDVERRLKDRHFVGHLGELAACEWFRGAGHVVDALFANHWTHARADLLVDDGDAVARSKSKAEYEHEVRRRRWHKGWGRARDTWGRVLDDSPPPMPTSGPAFNGLRVEVKTWRAHNWIRYGRSVNADQLFRVQDKADVILWVQLVHPASPIEVPSPWGLEVPSGAKAEIMGWSTVNDVFSDGIARWAPGLVAQAQLNPSKLRSLARLTPGARPGQLASGAASAGRPCEHAKTVKAGGDIRTRRDPGRLCWYCAWDDGNGPMPEVLMSTGKSRFFHNSSRSRIENAHGSWIFTAATHVAPVADACRHLAACPWCFDRSAG